MNMQLRYVPNTVQAQVQCLDQESVISMPMESVILILTIGSISL